MKRLLAGLLVVVLLGCSAPQAARQPLPTASASLQSLVNSTAVGGVLSVPVGTYTGNVVITKSITIEGNGSTIVGRLQVDGSNVVVKNLVISKPVKWGIQNLGNNNAFENISILNAQLSTDCEGCDDMDGARIAGDNVTLKNIHIDLSGVSNTGDAHPDCVQFATWIKRASNIVVDGLYCENFYKANDTVTGSNGLQLAMEDYGWENITIKNSVLHTSTCILAYSGQSGLRFEHNTCIGQIFASSTGFYSAKTSNDYFSNNILVNHYQPVIITSGITESKNNIVYCGAACRSDSGFSHIGQLWNVDPKLDANYRPLAGSPACLANGDYIGAYPCIATPPTATKQALTSTPTKAPTPTPTLTVVPPAKTATPAPNVSVGGVELFCPLPCVIELR